jgi:hypothetical protein
MTRLGRASALVAAFAGDYAILAAVWERRDREASTMIPYQYVAPSDSVTVELTAGRPT